jgi:putative aldouronate transport system permease protein
MRSVGYKKFGVMSLLNFIILTLFGLICVYPLYFILINSFSSPSEIIKGVFIYPRDISLDAYSSLNEIPGLASSVVISVLRTLTGSLLTALCSSFVAYLLTYNELPAKKFFYRFFILTMYVNAGFIPIYLLYTRLGLKNNFLVYILPSAVSAYFIILVKTYIESMPEALRESAEIDGAGLLTIYVKIILPLAKPIIACIIVFAAVHQWNAWSDDMFFMQGSKARNLHCLQFLLYQKLQSNIAAAISSSNNLASVAAGIEISPTSLRMAMTFITVMPILFVYPFMQRYFTKGIMLGAVKG